MNPFWDSEISRREVKKVLKHPRDRRFGPFLARILSYLPPYEVFHKYITPGQFKSHYPKVKRLVDEDLIGAGRLEFWDWLYKKL